MPKYYDNESILSRIDIRQEYESLGLRTNGQAPSADGWLEVHAMGREDRNPSASINLKSGFYKDHGGEGELMSLWDFAAKYGQFADWKAAKKHFAEKAGIAAKSKHRTHEYGSLAHAVLGVLKKERSMYHGNGDQVRWVATWDYGSFQVVRIDLPTAAGEKQAKTFRPIHCEKSIDGKEVWKLGFPKPDKNRPIYRLAEVTTAVDASLVSIHGGEKATDAGVGMGLLATTNAGGEQAIGKTDWTPLARFTDAVIVIDYDATGDSFGHKLAAILKKQNPSQVVRIVRVSDVPKGDMYDAAQSGMTKENFLSIVRSAPAVSDEQLAEWEAESHKRSHDREIEIGPDESRVVDEAIAALAEVDNVYQRGGNLVQVVEGAEAPRGISRPKDAPKIAFIRHARLRELLADAAAWYQPGDEERKRIHPPDWAIKAVDARGQWQSIPRLEAVVESPVLRANGTILQTPGYDEATGLLLRSDVEFPQAVDAPTRVDAIKAAALLLEVVEDFPFASDAHRSAWLASTLTPPARYAFHGCAPLNLLDANVRGCGKSLLTDVTSHIVAGREMARMSLPRDDEEFRKRITALAVAGEPIVLIDNIPGHGALGSPSLDAALTATSWSDRILGQSSMATGVPLFATWFATGNNVVLTADTARRTLHIRLESPEENPEKRSGFHHSDLLAWVRVNRPRLAVAAVTILAAYCTAGRPNMNLTPWGSFEAWSALVRSSIVWAGLPDPAATRTELTSQADREAVALRQLIAGWQGMDPDGTGLTVVGVLSRLAECSTEYSAIRGALLGTVSAKGW